MTDVVLVDENDNAVGLAEKVEAHTGNGKLHRAFTVLIFNSQGETLVAQRSMDKMLWPLYWDNGCASHPLQGEGYVEAGERRLTEELGFTCDLRIVDRFIYHEKYMDFGSENEVCTTLIGEYDGDIKPNPGEVADYKWMSIDDLKKDITAHPDIYTVWFKIALDRLIEKGIIDGNS